MTSEMRRWFAGVDWGSEKHQVCLLDDAGAVVGERAFRHDGAGLAALCDWLVSIAGAAGTVAVAIEVPHGPVVDALLDRGFAVHAINPKQLDRLRDRFSVAGATPGSRPRGCAPTRSCSGAWPSATPLWSSSASGRAWPRSCSRSACAWATASAS